MSIADAPGSQPGIDLLGLLGHDLRSPLTVVRGYAELLLQRGSELSPEGREGALAAICRSVDRMELVLDGLAELAEAVAETPGGPGAGDLPSTDAATVLREVIAELVPAGTPWHVEVAAPSPTVVMVEDRLRVTLSLVVGSFVRIGPEGEVSVEVGHRRGALQLRFHRASVVTTPARQLELELATALAASAGGHLWSDRGEVHVALPLAGPA